MQNEYLSKKEIRKQAKQFKSCADWLIKVASAPGTPTEHGHIWASVLSCRSIQRWCEEQIKNG